MRDASDRSAGRGRGGGSPHAAIGPSATGASPWRYRPWCRDNMLAAGEALERDATPNGLARSGGSGGIGAKERRGDEHRTRPHGPPGWKRRGKNQPLRRNAY
ncbi:unnamed protein product [Urochloa humidicola]